MVFDTVIADPENGGTMRSRKDAVMQLPVGVPANGGPTLTCVALPLGANVTCTLLLPVGPSRTTQPLDLSAAADSAAEAAPRSKSAGTDSEATGVGSGG